MVFCGTINIIQDPTHAPQRPQVFVSVSPSFGAGERTHTTLSVGVSCLEGTLSSSRSDNKEWVGLAVRNQNKRPPQPDRTDRNAGKAEMHTLSA